MLGLAGSSRAVVGHVDTDCLRSCVNKESGWDDPELVELQGLPGQGAVELGVMSSSPSKSSGTGLVGAWGLSAEVGSSFSRGVNINSSCVESHSAVNVREV